MDKSREQFEAWLKSTGHNPPYSVKRGYWEIWKASRAAIELDVDWPEANDDYWKEGEEGAYARGYEDGKDKVSLAVRKALSAAGIKVKGESDGDTEGRPTPP